MIRLVIDDPGVGLMNLNHRPHWARRASLTAAWRAAGHNAWLRAGLTKRSWESAHCIAIIEFPTKARVDPNNFYPTVKAIVDGIQDFHFLPDDDWQHLAGPDLRYGGVRPRSPRVTLVFNKRDPLNFGPIVET